MSAGPRIVLTAGGTGGHVFPAEALAAELLGRGIALALITDRRGGGFGGALGAVETHQVRAASVVGRGWAGRMAAYRELLLGGVQARALLRRLRPELVVGFGGYASLPAMLAARSARCRTLIHEQNAVLGRANRVLARRVDRLATAFARPQRLPPGSEGKVVRTGMPVRPAFVAARAEGYQAPARDGPVHLLVLGGSQGARVFSDVVPAAMGQLPRERRAMVRICQQCRPEDLQRVGAAYAELGMAGAAELGSFFADIPKRLAWAHLVIARAGASTVAELTTVGRPAILVPYPHAADDHQSANAAVIAAAGGARALAQSELSDEGLAALLAELWHQPETLATMAARARAAGMPEATDHLVDLVLEMLGNGCDGSAGDHRDSGRRAA